MQVYSELALSNIIINTFVISHSFKFMSRSLAKSLPLCPYRPKVNYFFYAGSNFDQCKVSLEAHIIDLLDGNSSAHGNTNSLTRHLIICN